jgi:hypothetical protein
MSDPDTILDEIRRQIYGETKDMAPEEHTEYYKGTQDRSSKNTG